MTLESPTLGAQDAMPAASAPAEGLSVGALRAAATWSPEVVIVAGFLLALGALALRRQPRRSTSVAAICSLFILAFEGGLHSVHHLGDDRGAAECSVASAMNHVAGAADQPPSAVGPASPISEPPADLPGLLTGRESFRPDAGRAPPRATA
jgi:hypothetical protein